MIYFKPGKLYLKIWLAVGKTCMFGHWRCTGNVFRNAQQCAPAGDEHLKATLRLVSSDEFKPNIEDVVDAKRCQLSSQK